MVVYESKWNQGLVIDCAESVCIPLQLPVVKLFTPR